MGIVPDGEIVRFEVCSLRLEADLPVTVVSYLSVVSSTFQLADSVILVLWT